MLALGLVFAACSGCRQASQTYGFASGNPQQDVFGELLAFDAWLHSQRFESTASPEQDPAGSQPNLSASIGAATFWYRGTFRGSPAFFVELGVIRQPATLGFQIRITAPTTSDVDKLKHELLPFLQEAQKLQAQYVPA